MSGEPSDVDRQFENEVSAFLRHNENLTANLTEMNLIHEAKMADQEAKMAQQHEAEMSAVLRHDEILTNMNLNHEAKMADQEAKMAQMSALEAAMQSTHEAKMAALEMSALAHAQPQTEAQDCDTGTCVTSS
jgi:GTP-binding protein EngB required for normal cell division